MDLSVRTGLELPVLAAGAAPDRVATWRATARAAESAGFGALWVPVGGADACTLAGGLVPATTTITLGVVGDLASGRHPAVLARDLTGLDVICGGRSALLLTAPPEPAGRLDEAVAICQALFDGQAPHLVGRHYSVDGAVNRPPPVRPGGPPILVQGPPLVTASPRPLGGRVVTGPPEALAPRPSPTDGPLVWRGPAPDQTQLAALERAGIEGVIAQVWSPDQVGPLWRLLGRWSA